MAEHDRGDDGRAVAVHQRGGNGRRLPVTTRRTATQHPQALSPGANVNATLVAATGPQIRVRGLSTNR